MTFRIKDSSLLILYIPFSLVLLLHCSGFLRLRASSELGRGEPWVEAPGFESCSLEERHSLATGFLMTDGLYQMLAHDTGLLSLVNLDCGSVAEKWYLGSQFQIEEELPQSWPRQKWSAYRDWLIVVGHFSPPAFFRSCDTTNSGGIFHLFCADANYLLECTETSSYFFKIKPSFIWRFPSLDKDHLTCWEKEISWFM